VHHEVELVIKINKVGKNIQEKFARNYFSEIGMGIDFTARDVQAKLKAKGLPWDLAKGFDGAAPLGNFIDVSQRESLQNISFGLQKNKVWVQQGNSHDMIFSFEKIIAFVSSYFTLKVGDLIYTGTPAGVGPVAIGDTLEAYLENELALTCEVK
jgi:2-keto-4-pentenoate hydratase/2-oxohepta-3-ene-1,7-dioic acid hydratase in catechol pathway